MASCFNANVELSVPKPILIFNDMGIQDWKNFFMQKMHEATDPAAKINYRKCFKTLLWAEFCNGTLSYVGNSKDKNGMTVKFTFQFTSFSCKVLFQKRLKYNLVVVAQH